MICKSCFIFILWIVLSAVPVAGQNLFRPPPPQTKNVVTLGWRGMIAVDVSFRHLGSIPHPRTDFTDTSLGGFEFYDGSIGKDSSYYSSSNPLPSDGLTSNWTIDSKSQLDGQTLSFHTYAAVANGTVNLSGDSGLANGWELQYVRYWSTKQRLGVLAGFSFNSFSLAHSGLFLSDLETNTYTLQDASFASIREAMPTNGGYEGFYDRFGQPVLLIPYPPDQLTNPSQTTMTPQGASGTGNWGVDASLFTFRLGPVYDFHLLRNFRLQVGGGMALVFCSTDFSSLETLTSFKQGGVAIEIPTSRQTPVFHKQRDSDWLFGGYVDANANYQFTERLQVYTGMQYQSTEDFTGYNEGRSVELKTGSGIFARAGIGLKF